MSKFKLKFKIQGLELEVEGSKEDVPNLTKAITGQLSNMLEPIIETIDTELIEDRNELPTKTLPKDKPKKRKPSKPNNTSQPKEEAIVNLNHNLRKHGSPSQDWSTLDKGVWLLEVLEMEHGSNEWTARELAETFNKHFKQAKTIRATNISRDFGKYKLGNDALVGENSNSKPSKWFLTEKGKNKARSLINPS